MTLFRVAMPMLSKTLTTFFLLALFMTQVQSHELTDALGPVYPVIEPDILAILQKHVAENQNETQKRVKVAQDRFKALLQNPKGVHLSRATELTVKTEAVPSPVASHIDPTYRRDWLFIDGDDQTDVDLARQFINHYRLPNGRVIAVSGSIDTLQKALQTRVWFDQQGQLIKRLQIEALPAWVTLTNQTIEVKTAPTRTLLSLITKTQTRIQ